MCVLNVGLIGTGAIGTNVVRYLADKKIPDVRLTSVYNRTPERAHELVTSLDTEYEIEVAPDPIAVTDRSDVVVETAGQSFIQQSAQSILETGTDLIVMSVGALGDSDLYTTLRTTAEENSSQLYVPSGAIAGLDGIGALGNGSLQHVTLECYRSPEYLEAYVDDDVDVNNLEDGQRIFDGTASEAATLFPSHMNVAIALTLAAKVEPDDVSVQIEVQHDAPRSRYVISVPSNAGSIKIEIKNFKTPQEPDQSLLNVYSVIEKIRRISDRVTIGT